MLSIKDPEGMYFMNFLQKSVFGIIISSVAACGLSVSP